MNKISILSLGLFLVFSAISCSRATSKEHCENNCGEKLQLCFAALVVKDFSAPTSNQSPNPMADAALNCSYLDSLCKADCKLKGTSIKY